MNAQATTTREAVSVFRNKKQLDKALGELEALFAREDINVLGDEKDIVKKFGKKAVEPEYLEDNPETPRKVPVMPEEKGLAWAALIGGFAYVAGCIAAIAASGMSNLALIGAITGGSLAGALIGAFIAVVISKRLNRHIKEQIKKGGLVLWVRTPDEESEKQAQRIFKKCGGKHIHVHNVT